MPPVNTLEGERAQIKNSGVEDHSDEVLGLMQENDPLATAEVTPVGGAVEVKEDWRVPNSETSTPAAEAAVSQAQDISTETEIPKITPISTGIPVTPVSNESIPTDSIFKAEAVVPDSGDKVEAFGADAPFVEEKKDMHQANEEFDQRVAETQATFENKIGEVAHVPGSTVEVSVDPSAEQVDSISDPEERFEARQESAKDILAKMKEDLMAINEGFDKKLSEAQEVFEQKISRSNELEAEAKSLTEQAEEKKMEAFNIKTEAQNELERVQGEVSGKKAEIAAKQEKIESLEV